MPVLVIDDHSDDATAQVAEMAGARVLRLPVHLGLGGCVQTGYKLAYEMGFDYVIRVDGDGQHEAADIPKILDTLIATGSEFVIGSRFIEDAGNQHIVREICGYQLLPGAAEANSGTHDSRSDFRLRRRQPESAAGLRAQFSALVS